MSLELTGKLIKKYDEQQVTQTFKKREFVIELSQEINGSTYTNFAKLQLTQAKCDIIKDFNENDNIKISFNVRGSKYVKDGKENYITNLEAWRIEHASAATAQPGNNQQAPPYNNNNNNNQGYNQGNNNQGFSQGNNNQGFNQGNNPPGNYSQAGGANTGADAVDDLPF
ncbi:MAG: DUF3127 domain-containing protein [Taibaiella sp.]|nr:DUF3127 domain-containing protein [Taibaiella sp.]